mgnify:CR=1 FL=1
MIKFVYYTVVLSHVCGGGECISVLLGLHVVSVDLICFRIYLSIYSLIVFTVYFPLLFTDYPGPPRLALLPAEPGHEAFIVK